MQSCRAFILFGPVTFIRHAEAPEPEAPTLFTAVPLALPALLEVLPSSDASGGLALGNGSRGHGGPCRLPRGRTAGVLATRPSPEPR